MWGLSGAAVGRDALLSAVRCPLGGKVEYSCECGRVLRLYVLNEVVSGGVAGVDWVPDLTHFSHLKTTGK